MVFILGMEGVCFYFVIGDDIFCIVIFLWSLEREIVCIFWKIVVNIWYVFIVCFVEVNKINSFMYIVGKLFI